jgi:protein-tyrosine-phosphatase
MKVAVICRMNQVRSTFSEILLTSQFPEIDFCSAGVSSVAGNLPITRVTSVATEWGLNALKLMPKGILDIRDFIESCDLLLLAEDSFAQCFLDWQITGRIKSFDQITLDENFIPKDPVNFGENDFKVELAKIGYVAIRAIELENMQPSSFPIKIVIPLNASDAELAFTYARFASSNEKGILIDVDFRSPNAREFATEEECMYFDPDTLNASDYQKTLHSLKILSPNREFRTPERILISRDFRTKIREFANIAPVTLISAPRCIQGVPIPDSYLAAISATVITTIGC